MSNTASDAKAKIVKNSIYFKAWVPNDNQDDAQITAYKNDYYDPVISFISNDQQTAIVTCVKDDECKAGNGHDGSSYSDTIWDEDTETGTINLCDPWFDNTNFPSTSHMFTHCGEQGRTVEEFETLAATLLHEFLHLGVCEHIHAPFKSAGEVYSSVDCDNLARTNGDKAMENADSWMLVTMGMYWDKTCNGRIKTGVPALDNSPTPISVSSTPYAIGTCSFHLTETQDCDSNYGNNLYSHVKMYDNNRAVIGETVNDNSHLSGYAMDAGNSYSFTSKLPNPLVITGEHDNDYVQFSYGGLSWQSKKSIGGGSCSVGGWDLKDGPICGSWTGNHTVVCQGRRTLVAYSH